MGIVIELVLLFVVIGVLIGVFGIIDSKRDSNAAEVVRLRRDLGNALDTIDTVRKLALDYSDVNDPVSAVILDEIRKYDRKELRPND